jgi:hypothetical protein
VEEITPDDLIKILKHMSTQLYGSFHRENLAKGPNLGLAIAGICLRNGLYRLAEALERDTYSLEDVEHIIEKRDQLLQKRSPFVEKSCATCAKPQFNKISAEGRAECESCLANSYVHWKAKDE